MRISFIALVLTILSSAGFAGSATPVEWSDLGSRIPAESNPYFGLTADEARLVGILVQAETKRKSGTTLSSRELQGETIANAALESVGIDGASKVLAVQQFDRKMLTSQNKLNKELLGQEIEIPGFVLPLELDGNNVTEFLLVPFAGACVHTPPPPGNQIIHIASPDGFAMRGLFDPVIVQGTLHSSGASMDVSLSDGDAEFPVGYKMTSDSIEFLN